MQCMQEEQCFHQFKIDTGKLAKKVRACLKKNTIDTDSMETLFDELISKPT